MTASSTAARRRESRGVTLLELIVAVSILGTVAALLWGTFSRTWSSRVYAESRAGTYAIGRAAIGWLERDIAGTGVAHGYPDGSVLFVSSGLGERETDEFETELLHITTASALGTAPLEYAPGADIPLPGPQRGDQARILYRLENDDDDIRSTASERLSLVRYEWRPPGAGEREDAARAVIVDRVLSLRLRFSDDGETWRETWDTTAAGVRHVPRIVETRLVIADSDEEPIEFVSAVGTAVGGIESLRSGRGRSSG